MQIPPNAFKTFVIWIASTAFLFAAFEWGLRLRLGAPLGLVHFLGLNRSLFRSAYPTQYDPLLGWIPKANTASQHTAWKTSVTIDTDGFRSNGVSKIVDSNESQILAVGDSFTFGDEVSDTETWPANLERILGYRTVNAGVFGYGLDQSTLRAEQLAPRLKPRILIVSLIPEDIIRTQLSIRTGAAKPYFALGPGEDLILRNVPVPPTSNRVEIGPIRTLTGYSFLVHEAMIRIAPLSWYRGSYQERQNEKVHGNGLEVSCRLLTRLHELGRRLNFRILIVGQYLQEENQSDLERIQRVLSHGRQLGLETLDFWPLLQTIKANDPKAFQQLFIHHMSPTGNHYVAQKIAEHLRTISWI